MIMGLFYVSSCIGATSLVNSMMGGHVLWILVSIKSFFILGHPTPTAHHPTGWTLVGGLKSSLRSMLEEPRDEQSWGFLASEGPITDLRQEACRSEAKVGRSVTMLGHGQ